MYRRSVTEVLYKGWGSCIKDKWILPLGLTVQSSVCVHLVGGGMLLRYGSCSVFRKPAPETQRAWDVPDHQMLCVLDSLAGQRCLAGQIRRTQMYISYYNLVIS